VSVIRTDATSTSPFMFMIIVCTLVIVSCSFAVNRDNRFLVMSTSIKGR
jgi:hypothetical protein